MARVRKDILKMSNPWDPTVLWYARAVREMQKRPIKEPTSWRYLAAIHGFDSQLWQQHGYLQAGEALPSAADQNTYWRQCQHQSWYFMPWHRGYLAAFEAIVLAEIVKLGGPADWALPYWNYSDSANAKARDLPTCFQSKTLPDGGANPLWLAQRYGWNNQPNHITLRPETVQLTALKDAQFIGTANGIPPGYGGPQTPFWHGGGNSGGLENLPHNPVHTNIGGRNGLMSDPDLAGLDPVFWIHHSNIDRLWQVWLNRNPRHQNPSSDNWLEGPVNRKFAMPRPNGSGYTFVAKDMLNTQAPNLNYVYQDVSDPLGGASRAAQRMQTLAAIHLDTAAATTMANNPKTELLGANATAIKLGNSTVHAQMQLDSDAKNKVLSSFQASQAAARQFKAQPDAAPQEPDRVFLSLENIRCKVDGGTFNVYVGLPQGADPAQHPQNLAGTIALFGARKASLAEHGGNGVSQTLEITDIVDRMCQSQTLDAAPMGVQLVPVSDIEDDDEVTIGRISVYRHGE
ncbi:tyrosinase [Chromobacterium alkanivorans]|uniref:tyrosinase family protein n=1 Tax=Chromobacterium TaxID=535 RepID=UPI000652BE03|nr:MULTISPECIES: tyrosinase family protein [Chromobacterium]KMN81475.1 hypothetical protein VK98_13380 [Chromobacterium sp. LK11]MCS3803888.1 tyrosinase [Chromobacterium alkanivorans]MCS3818007.1 tyrosinase [Chromobacterium alkanivorans]MCS3875627.1 tyrosinase [Chromobacterium alkanivorans]